MVKRIEAGDKILAIIVSSRFEKDGIEFFTPPEFSQQLGYMKRPSGYRIAPHRHNLVPREVNYTQETLIVRSGRVRVDLFDDDKRFVTSEILVAQDVILLASGGHGFEFLEETELIEVKQGPYISFDVDKDRFDDRRS